MRISTGMIYDSGLSSIQNRTSTLLQTQQQLATGRRVLSPSDDPVAAARALEVAQAKGVNLGQAEVRNSAKSSLGIADAQLQSSIDLMARVRELAVQGANASLSAADRRSIAMELRARYEEMMGLANSRDGTGLYLFGGYQTGNKPFSGNVESGAVYGGDNGVRTLGVSTSRNLAISDSGNDVFMRIKNGNGTFITGMQNEKSVNANSVVYESALTALNNPPANTGSFELRFWVDTVGGVATPSQAVGTVDLNAATAGLGLTLTTGGNSEFDVTVNGVTVGVDLDTVGTGTTYTSAGAIAAELQTQLTAGGANAIVNVDTNGYLVVTSNTTGAGSNVTMADVNGLGTVFGAPIIAPPGTVGAANTTYYDLVNTAGNSLFTGAASTTGVSGTYTNAYVPGTALNFSNAGPNAFDYGASVYFTGAPQTGDTFTVSRTATDFDMTAKTLSQSAQAVIDKGAVTDPIKWSNPNNKGNYELRFWTDTQGVIATSGQSVGSVSLPTDITVGAGNQFNLSINGAPAVPVILTAGTYTTPAAFASHVQTRINAALGVSPPTAGSASVTLDSNNRLVLASTTPSTTTTTSSVTLTENNGALAAYFGSATATNGIAPLAGQTFYDWVDPATSNSLFTGGVSTTGSPGTFNHLYDSNTPISLSSSGGPGQLAFDFGAEVTITGAPANGDTFVVKASSDPTGNGSFTTEPKRAAQYNAGSGIIGVGEVFDARKWNSPLNSRNLEVRFWQDPEDLSDPKTTYYDLVDTETEKSLFTDNASTAGGAGNTFTREFKAGDSISFAGLHAAYGEGGTAGDFGIAVTIQGTPASGDAFTIQPSSTESVFGTLSKLILALEAGAPVGTLGGTHLGNEVGQVLNQVSNIEDNILRVRASIGSRLSEIDNLDAVGENMNLQYEETLSRLQDLDYAAAITKLTREQVELQAAQQSFTRIAQLSLFNYIS